MTTALGSWPLLVAAVAAIAAGLSGVTASRSADPARHVRGRLWIALGVFGVVLIASWSWSTAQPSLLGLPIVVGPGAAAAAGVLAFALPPAPTGASGSRRIATVRARSAAQVVGGRVLVLPGALLAVLVAVLVTTGITGDASGDAAGRAFSIVRPGLSASASPYPGWYYGVPVLVTSAVLVLAVVVAVRRIVLLPAMTADEAADGTWRAAVGRALGSIAAAALLLYLAGVLWAAGAAWEVLMQTGTTGLTPFATIQGLVSQLSALAAVVLLVVTGVRTASVGRAVTRNAIAA